MDPQMSVAGGHPLSYSQVPPPMYAGLGQLISVPWTQNRGNITAVSEPMPVIQPPPKTEGPINVSVSVLTYDDLLPFLAPENILKKNSYPFLNDENGMVKFFEIPHYMEGPKKCARCKQELNKVKGPCVYHRDKIRRIDTITSCCRQSVNAAGCEMCERHVHGYNKFEVTDDYVELGPPLPRPCGFVNAFAIDCEMVYTTLGMELGRVTVLNAEGETVYDRKVRPTAELIDPNTRYSGLTAEEVERAGTNLEEVQQDLLKILDSDSILIGHSLENDLVALKILQNNKIIDTALIFTPDPEKGCKKSLKDLTKYFFKKTIQEGSHDSAVDARACIDLMKYAIGLRRTGFCRILVPFHMS